MKNTIFGIIVGLAIGIGGAWMLLRHHEEKEEKAEEKKEESVVQHGTNGEVFLKLNKEAQEHSGIKVSPLEAIETKQEIRAYGRVLDPSLLATQLVDIGTTRATVEASRKEFERLKALNAQNQNVSARSLEAAEAAVKRDDILLEAAQAKLRLTWGEGIAGRKDLSEFVESLVSLRAALVRIDLPIGEGINGTPSGARVGPMNADTNLVEAKFLGVATSADPQMQGQGFLFGVATSTFLPGAAVSGYLAVSGEPKKGVLVPGSALVRYEGEVFIYVQKGEDKFEREEVKLDVPLKNGWLVTHELEPGEKVVVTGAQQLLSEELKSHMGEE
jgi:hypothetical protein